MAFSPRPANTTIFNYLHDLTTCYNTMLDAIDNLMQQHAPQHLHRLPPSFDDSMRSSMPAADAMRAIEEIIACFYSCSMLMENLYCIEEDEQIKELIVDAHDEFCRQLDKQATKLHKKFGTHPPKLGFLIDDCYVPSGFEENNCVIEYILLHFFASSLQLYQHQLAPITITFRDEANGHGAIFDHRTIQIITGNTTVISMPPSYLFRSGTNQMAVRLDNDYIPDLLTGHAQTPGDQTMPHVAEDDPNHSGLLIVPGYSSNTPKKRPKVHRDRTDHEMQLVKRANSTGQPTLAICGGMWTMIRALGGHIADLPAQRRKAHTSKMPRLTTAGDVTDNNVQHDIITRPGSELARLTGLNLIAVTSVHWASVTRVPSPLRVTAKAALRPDAAHPKGQIFDNEYEAVESVSGRMMGTQFHPEATSDNHPDGPANHAIIRDMAAKGQCFFKYRQVVRELNANGNVGLFNEINRSINSTDQIQADTYLACPSN